MRHCSGEGGHLLLILRVKRRQCIFQLQLVSKEDCC
jgi:hypothetical protein